MNTWSVNYLFLANAALLILLACFPVMRKRSTITWTFFVTTIALALWSVANFLIEQRLGMQYVSLYARVQCLGGMTFGAGLYYFCSSYPVGNDSKTNWLNGVIYAAFVAGIFGTNYITDAEFINNEVVYRDGPGFLYFSL